MRSIYTESRIDSYRYYHLSKDDGLTIMKPRVPDNWMTRNKYEDSKTPRVSFAPSINQCLMGMSKNLTGEEFYVYTPYLIDLNKLKKPHINQVPDAGITGEVWATQDIRVKKVGKIKVIGDANKDGHPYIFGNQQTAELYDWEYKVLIDEAEQSLEEITKEDIELNSKLYPIFIINTYTGSSFGKLMKSTLKFEYTHALLSLDSSLTEMYSYDDNKMVNGKLYKGLIIDDFSRYQKDYPNSPMRVTAVFVDEDIKNNIRHSINYYKKNINKTAYSYFNLFGYLKGSNRVSSWGDMKLFCSEFVDTILKHNNIDITGKNARNVSPDDLGKYTERNNIFILYEGLIKNYNQKEIEKKISELKLSVDHINLNSITPRSMKRREDIIINKKFHLGEIPRNLLAREDTIEVYDNTRDHTLNSDHDDIEFELPSLDIYKPDIQTLFDNTDPKHIWLTSDWHFFKNHYKKEANYVNTRDILTWCRQHLKQEDVFVYLGDLSFRYANKEDQELSQKFMASIPAGRKIFVLGNHDKMLGAEYFTKCGFDYVVEEFTWDKYIFTHRSVNMSTFPEDWWNIHGHIHNIRKYNTCDGKRNINVYPMFYNNKPVTLEYLVTHKEELVKDNEWNFNAGYGESAVLTEISKLQKLSEAQYRNNNPKPIVYYSPNIDSETIAYMVSLFQDKIGSRVGIKLHFGETGNKNFLNPKLLKDLVKHTNAALIDSNTAYEGSTRGTTNEHIQTAHNNGFDFGFIDILDADGDIVLSVPKRYQIEHELNELHNGKPGYESPVTPGRHLGEINVGSHLKNYDSLIVYTHFKGHSVAGYGGALKNIGMGIPSGKVGKMQIHGQGWEKGPLFLERLVESASAVEAMFDDKIIYVNVLANISTMCDCDKDAPKATIPNIGVLVSDDIVAIEQASIDFIRNTPKNKDIMEQIAKLGGLHQIEYMKYLGMGRSDYRLKTLDNETIKLESVTAVNENKILNGYTVQDIQKLFDSIPKCDVSYGQKHKDYKETIYRDMVPGKAFIELYKSPEGEDIASIAIEVHPDYRSQGLGTKLVKAAISNMSNLGINRIEWYCNKSNTASVKLAEKCGFKIDNKFSNKDKYTLYYGNKIIQEGYIKDEPDLYWKRKEFNEGKINLCFITGLSGSGKSTMGADMAGKPNVDHADMDNVVFNCNFDDKELANLGDLINAFFKGPGRQYRLEKGDLKSVTNSYRAKISNTFVDFAIKYAKSHKNSKFIVEGVYLFWMVSPEKLKDFAVYVKGTSSIKSAIRAAKRDGGMQDNTKDKVIVFSKTLAKKFYGMTYNTGNIDRWRKYYQDLQDKEKETMKEAYILPKKDIYYNRDKFNSGEINLCFITGQSGSGKSTMGGKMQGKAEVYDLDDVIWNKESFTMANFKDYGELIYSFFTGKGNKYYITADELKGITSKDKDDKPKPKNDWNYEHDLITDFVDYAISWAKSHPNIKYVLEGIWIYMYIEPSKLKDFAVYIKGTSMVTSIYRASKRDHKFKSNILHPGMWLNGEKALKKYRDYFEPRTKETVHETKRSNLPDSAFGIPEDRKYPLDTEQHVKSAIHLFGHAEESKKKSLARRIRSAAKKYDIKIPETTQCYKYLSEGADIIPAGIENIIFDMGSVLVDAHTLQSIYNNPNIPDEYGEEIKDFVNEKLFYGNSVDYKRKVQQFTIPQVREFLNNNLPEHIKPYTDDILSCFGPAMFKYEYAEDMLQMLKNKGYKLYYLSNWDRYSYELEKDFFDPFISKYFDGGIFSFELGGILKPDREMYEALCNKYSIFANKSIFFDDKIENCDAAKLIGMQAYQFIKEETPKILFGSSIIIPEDSDNQLLILDGDEGFKKIPTQDIGWWYICETKTPSDVDEECYYKTLEDCVRIKVNDLNKVGTFTDDTPYIQEYVFTNAKAFAGETTPPKLVKVGVINIYEAGTYEWEVQYPLKLEFGLLSSIHEYSMASMNPVIGINKPFLIKVGDQNHPELLPTNHYVYSQDIESDKVLTIDENHHLKVKKVKDLNILAVYEFVGDKAYIDRLNKYYKENAEVSSLYSALTGKPMLTEDQIDFDPCFRQIDFDLIEQKQLSELATLRDSIVKAMNYKLPVFPVIETAVTRIPKFMNKYNDIDDIIIKEDFDGAYFYSNLTKKRSASVASVGLLTENMIKSIL